MTNWSKSWKWPRDICVSCDSEGGLMKGVHRTIIGFFFLCFLEKSHLSGLYSIDLSQSSRLCTSCLHGDFVQMRVILLWCQLLCRLQTDARGSRHFLVGRLIVWAKNRLGPTTEPCGALESTGSLQRPCFRLRPVVTCYVEVSNPFGEVWVNPHVFQFVNEFVVINFIKRFTEVHDNGV